MGRTAWLQDSRMRKFSDVLSRYERRELSGMEAAEILGMSERTFRRYRRRHEAEGAEGLYDRRLGKASARRVPADELAAMLERYRTEYRGWNVSHFHEEMCRKYAFPRSYTWTKLRLQEAGLAPKAPRRGRHCRKRERKPCVGMMLHQDGSSHEWLEGQPQLDLIVTMDDATSEIYSAFLIEEEGTASSFRGLMDVFAAKGLPQSLYTDRGSHYFHTPEAGGKVDKENPTQVGRALAHLGVDHIPAYSPEARGRSERMFGTLQDRLVKELAKAGIAEIEAANRFIAEDYLPRHNKRFSTDAALPESGFVEIADPALLAETLCVHEERVVARDNTIRLGKLTLQLPASPERPHYVKARVKVHRYPDDTLAVFRGPGRIADYDAKGALLEEQPTKQAA